MNNGDHNVKPNGEALEVAIVGAGLVGSLCACFLAKQGHHVTVYEYRDDIRTSEVVKGRSVNLALSTRGRVALSEVGLEDTIVKEHGLPMKGRMIHNVDGSKYPIMYDDVKKQCIYSANRKFMNEILLTAAEKYPNVKMFFNTKLKLLNAKEGVLSFSRSDCNQEFEVKADLVIGADGAYSTVRKEFMKLPMFNYSQEYVEQGYIELYIPAGQEGQFLMEPDYLHIWPRGTFLMIALPNQDHSWTVTLFMPFAMFNEIKTQFDVLEFFRKYFKDALKLMTEERLVCDYFSTKPSPLISIKCNPYHVNDKTLIMGDAAHAMVPFYGQGMNAGFEDCYIFDQLMHKYNFNLSQVLPEFSEMRYRDAHAICDLAMYNCVEMRALVRDKKFLLRKKLDSILYKTFSEKWLPLYQSVTFTQTKYSQCIENKEFQDQVLLNSSLLVLGILFLIIILTVF